MSKRVYKFMSGEHGISNLADHRVKLSTIDDLNDPFDLCSIDTSDPQVNRLITAHITEFRANNALLCFSRNWDNLLMWSHYGDSHTGLCFGFDLPDGPTDLDVRYQPNLLKIRAPEDVNFDLMDHLLRTKHESWSYEQEVRAFVDIKNETRDAKGLMWFDFGAALEIKEVIVGAQFHPKNRDGLLEKLKAYGDAVECTWAYMRSDAFLLVRSSTSHTFKALG